MVAGFSLHADQAGEEGRCRQHAEEAEDRDIPGWLGFVVGVFPCLEKYYVSPWLVQFCFGVISLLRKN